LPIARFEADLAKAKRLPWVDFNTGKPLRLDRHGSHTDGTPVIRLNKYIETYHRHPEAKAADQNGNSAGPDTVGLLGRLRVRSEKLVRFGKEVDRLDQDHGASLGPDWPAEYERDDLAGDIDYLSHLAQKAIAAPRLAISISAYARPQTNSCHSLIPRSTSDLVTFAYVGRGEARALENCAVALEIGIVYLGWPWATLDVDLAPATLVGDGFRAADCTR
jgi:hypothetical protein